MLVINFIKIKGLNLNKRPEGRKVTDCIFTVRLILRGGGFQFQTSGGLENPPEAHCDA